VILAVDQGTTVTHGIVFDDRGRPTGSAYREFRQRFPQPGWVEHDANEIWNVTRAVAHEALDAAGTDGRGLAGIGITNQRETVVTWEPMSGEPLHRALVWQDRRTAARCDELREDGKEPLFRERTGRCSASERGSCSIPTSRAPRWSGSSARRGWTRARHSGRSTRGSCSS